MASVLNSSFLLSAMTAAVVGYVASAYADDTPKEKCYGIAKAGKNDCASAGGSNSCAGHSTKDGEGNAFIVTPKGLCDRLVGGSTTPKG